MLQYADATSKCSAPSCFRFMFNASLFWAVQTITSIGYGNVIPFTVAEYCVSSALMLLSGVMWAYIIGELAFLFLDLQ